MAGEWIVTDFASVIDFQEGPGVLAKDFRDCGVPLIRLSGLDRGASLLTGCNFLDPNLVAKKWAHFSLRKGDILLSTSASLGRIAVVDDEAEGAIAYTGIIRMRPRDERLIAPFIRYLLEGPNFQQQAEAFGAGSVIRHFGPMHLRQMTVLLPPPEEQRAIAHILGALDDKIELNRKQNATLEAMARDLFKAWFVDFEPVRAKIEGRWQRGVRADGCPPLQPGLPAHLYDLFPDRLVESELGEIPEGWVYLPVSEFAELKGGKQLGKEKIASTGPIPVFGGAGVMGYTNTYNADGFVIAVGRVGAYCGQFFSHRGKAWINNNASLIKQTDEDLAVWLFLALSHADIDVIKKGAAQPFVSNGDIAKLPLMWPTKALVNVFTDIVSPMQEEKDQHNQESRTLAALRDTLLPKLISGELRVADAEKFMDRAERQAASQTRSES